MKAGIAIFLGIFLIAATSIVSGVTTQTSLDDADNSESMVLTACAKCHGIDKVCKKLGKKTLKEWDRTVSRMIKKGADIPGDKKDTVIEYLFSLDPESKPVCP